MSKFDQMIGYFPVNFEKAIENAPSIVFLDDMDKLFNLAKKKLLSAVAIQKNRSERKIVPVAL